MDNYYGVKKFTQTMRKHNADERLRFTLDKGGIDPFLKVRGLMPLEHLDDQEMEKAFLTDESGQSIGRVTGAFRFVSASPSLSRPGIKAPESQFESV